MIKPSLGWKPVFMRVSTILLQYYMLKLAQILQRNLHAGLVDDCIFEVISPLTILPHSNMPICCNIYMPYCDNIVTIFVAQICRRLRGERHLFARLLLCYRIYFEKKKHVQKFQSCQSYLPACGWALIIGDGTILELIDMLYYNE